MGRALSEYLEVLVGRRRIGLQRRDDPRQDAVRLVHVGGVEAPQQIQAGSGITIIHGVSRAHPSPAGERKTIRLVMSGPAWPGGSGPPGCRASEYVPAVPRARVARGPKPAPENGGRPGSAE